MSLNRRKNRQSVGWSSEMERGGWAGGPSRAPWSLRYLHEGAPSRLPLAGWGGSSGRQRTSINKRPTRPKPAPVGNPLHTNPLTRVVTLVFPPRRFLWHVLPPPRYTCSRGRDLCACPQPHPLCGPRKVFENQGIRQTSRAPEIGRAHV